MIIKLSEKASVWDLDTPSSRMHQGGDLHLKELLTSVWKRLFYLAGQLRSVQVMNKRNWHLQSIRQ